MVSSEAPSWLLTIYMTLDGSNNHIRLWYNSAIQRSCMTLQYLIVPAKGD